MKKLHRLTALLSASLLSVSLLAGCDGANAQPPKETETPAVSQTETTEAAATEAAATEAPATEAVETLPQPTEPANTVKVTTPYGDLYYQEQWEEFMKTEQSTEGDTVKVSFAAEFNGQRYPLFDIVIGTGEDEPVAQITDASGVKHNVYVIFAENLEYPELGEEEQNLLCAMQEDINFVMEHIR